MITLNEKQTALVNDLASDFKPVVAEIEQSPATTQNHYGRYGALISTISKGNKTAAAVVALALVQAGANRQGVADAMRCFT